jgi:hypothetical protein
MIYIRKIYGLNSTLKGCFLLFFSPVSTYFTVPQNCIFLLIRTQINFPFSFQGFDQPFSLNPKMTSLWDMALCSVVEVENVSEVRTSSILSKIMEAIRTTETSGYLKETSWLCIPDCYNINTRRRVKLKSHPFDPFHPSSVPI